MEDHVREFREVVNSLSALKIILPAEILSSFLLATLPESFATFVTALEARESELDLATTTDLLLQEAARRTDQEIDTTEALVAHRKGFEKGKASSYSGARQMAAEGKAPPGPCICGEMHWRFMCPHRKAANVATSRRLLAPPSNAAPYLHDLDSSGPGVAWMAPQSATAFVQAGSLTLVPPTT